jgi:hypothetical protein
MATMQRVWFLIVQVVSVERIEGSRATKRPSVLVFDQDKTDQFGVIIEWVLGQRSLDLPLTLDKVRETDALLIRDATVS